MLQSKMCQSIASTDHLPSAPSIPRQENTAGDTAKAPPRTMRTRVYVAGPLSKGNTLVHIHAAVQAATALLQRGYAPYVPHLTCFWEIMVGQEFTYEQWMELDVEFLEACDVLLRLPGESAGADREVEIAKKTRMPVYLSLDTLVACEKPTRELK